MFSPAGRRPRTDRPDPASRHAVRLGELLVELGQLTPAQVLHILDVQAVTHRPFGDLAERLFAVSPRVVATAWAEQFARRNPPLDVADQPCDPKCLCLVTGRQAWQFRMVPMRREFGHLLVAVEAERLLNAVNFAGRTLPISPCFLLAEPRSLRTLMMRHYPVGEHVATHAFGA